MSDFIILNNFFSRFSAYGSRYRSAEDDGAKEADSPPRKDRVPLGANEVGEGEEAKGGGVGALSVGRGHNVVDDLGPSGGLLGGRKERAGGG